MNLGKCFAEFPSSVGICTFNDGVPGIRFESWLEELSGLLRLAGAALEKLRPPHCGQILIFAKVLWPHASQNKFVIRLFHLFRFIALLIATRFNDSYQAMMSVPWRLGKPLQ